MASGEQERGDGQIVARQMITEPRLRVKFRNWLAELSDDQVAALDGHWENIMNDAALDRIDSWIIAGNAIALLRSQEGPACIS